MAQIANTSYVTDLAELEQYTDLRHVRHLASRRDEDDSEAPLDDTPGQDHRYNYVINALNTAARTIENLWRKHYNLTPSGKITDAVSASSPSERVKDWNVRLGVHIMEVRRPGTDSTELRQALIDEIITALDQGSPEVFPDSRSQQLLPAVGGSVRPIPGALVADQVDQFDSVIPRTQRGSTNDF